MRKVGTVSEKSITRQQAWRFTRAKTESPARRSLAESCWGPKIHVSRDERELGYAGLESKSEVPANVLPATQASPMNGGS